ncbi:MAG: hypothetical protein ACREJQ_03525, partial [bacterium]
MAKTGALSAAVAGLLAVQGLAALASTPKAAQYNSYDSLKRGTADSVSITSDGEILLSPLSKKVADITDPFVWAATTDGAGNLYVGTGNDGKVYKITPKGDASVYFDSEEPEVHALAFGPDDALYAATSPDGKVYRITGEGKADSFFAPGEKYIWALAFEKNGSLLVATGEKGKLYRVNRGGEGKVLFEPGQSHVRSIALGRKGEIYLGTSDEGIIYRIDANGNPFALYDSAFQEIVALVAGDNGVYAAGGSATARAKPPAQPPGGLDFQSLAQSILSGGGGDNNPDMGGISDMAQQMMSGMTGGPPPPPPPGGKKAGVIWVSNDGVATTLWDAQDNLYSMTSDGDTLIAGTGDSGKLYRVTKDGKTALLDDFDEKQITAFARVGAQNYACTSNLARVYALDGTFESAGTYTSEVYDTQTISDWGAVFVDAGNSGGSVTVSTRTGNTKSPEKTWSGWQKVASDHVASPSARFVQWKAELAGSGQTTPKLNSLWIAYLQKNLPPQIQSLTFSEPGTVPKPGQPPAGGGPGGGGGGFDYETAVATAMQTMGFGGGDSGDYYGGADNPPPPPTPQPRAPMQKGYRTISWRATDPNKDRLKYSLHYRGAGESQWKLLKDNLMVTMYNWDATTVPDGKYVLKLVASDAPSNPDPMARTDEMVSDELTVDNTPPAVSMLKG